jgi:ABC-type multidrug transport system fused ATPase/permease subunit
MQRSLFVYILNHSAPQQSIVLSMTVASLPFYYFSLDLPKRIINQAIDASPDKFPRRIDILGKTVADLGQLEFLMALCGAFLLLVLINGAFKYAINVYKGLLGERMLRRLRYQLYALILRFPLSQFRKISHGEMVSIVASEVEPLGGFIGDAYALPLYQGGLLLTALGFIFVQDPIMGLAVIALYPVQAAVIPRLQYQVNQLGKQRVQEVRRLSNRLTETISLAREIRANDIVRHELAGFTGALGRIFDIRYRIYRKKFFIKFLNNFIAQLTPFFFFSIGGYLVIRGELSLGALVAVLAAYKDLAPPWKELLDYYQAQQDARIRYEQIVAQFDIPDLEPPDVPDEKGLEDDLPDGEIVVEDVAYAEDGVTRLTGVSFAVHPGEHLAILGDANSGKDALALVLAGLVEPTAGRVRIGDTLLEAIPAGVIGRAIAYTDGQPAFLTGTLFDNLTLGLKQNPIGPAPEAGPTVVSARHEAIATANSVDDPAAEWIDLAAAGVHSTEELTQRAIEVLELVEIDQSLYEFGLRARIDPERHPELADRILELRAKIAKGTTAAPLADVIEPFSPDAYNSRLSVGENLMFGEPVGDRLDLRRMADDRYVRSTLKRTGIDADLIALGHEIAVAATTMINDGIAPASLEDGLLPVTEAEIPQIKLVVGLAARKGPSGLPVGSRRFLESLALRMNGARHRHIAIPPGLQAGILRARASFREKLPGRLRPMIAFLDPSRLNPALTVGENIIFGAFAENSISSRGAVNKAISEVVDAVGVKNTVRELGLLFHVGAGGSHLSASQRQKLAIARAIIKRPRVLIMCDAFVGLDAGTTRRLVTRLQNFMAGQTTICATHDPSVARLYDRAIVLRDGAVSNRESAENRPHGGDPPDQPTEG